jgi:hypothetical protein
LPNRANNRINASAELTQQAQRQMLANSITALHSGGNSVPVGDDSEHVQTGYFLTAPLEKKIPYRFLPRLFI